MNDVIDEIKKPLPPVVAQASAEYKANRDQILAISETSGYKMIVAWHERELARITKELLTASLNTESDKKHLLTVRGEHNISSGFLQYLKNLEQSKEREEK